MTVHKETGGFDMALGHPVELFADVLADLSQIISALAAGTRCRFVAMFNARQVLGEWLTTGTRAWCAWRRFDDHGSVCLLLSQFCFGRR